MILIPFLVSHTDYTKARRRRLGRQWQRTALLYRWRTPKCIKVQTHYFLAAENQFLLLTKRAELAKTRRMKNRAVSEKFFQHPSRSRVIPAVSLPQSEMPAPTKTVQDMTDISRNRSKQNPGSTNSVRKTLLNTITKMLKLALSSPNRVSRLVRRDLSQ